MSQKTVCVAGASGLVGSQIVKLALEKGYKVNGTLRNKDDETSVPFLKALPNADKNLTLFSSDMSKPGSFDAALKGTDGVFIATLIPLYSGPISGKKPSEMTDEEGYAEIINPTRDGCINILESAKKAGVKTAVVCSSTSSTNPVPQPKIKNEDHWSDSVEQISNKKYPSAAKTLMEKAALKFGEDNGIRVSIFLPTLMLGPLVVPKHIDAGINKLFKALVSGAPPLRERMSPGSMSFIHIEDLAGLFLAAYENPEAKGRYLGVKASWTWVDVYAEIKKLVPEAKLPKPLEAGQEPEEPTQFDFTRQDTLGVKVRDVPEILSATVDAMKKLL